MLERQLVIGAGHKQLRVRVAGRVQRNRLFRFQGIDRHQRFRRRRGGGKAERLKDRFVHFTDLRLGGIQRRQFKVGGVCQARTDDLEDLAGGGVEMKSRAEIAIGPLGHERAADRGPLDAPPKRAIANGQRLDPADGRRGQPLRRLQLAGMLDVDLRLLRRIEPRRNGLWIGHVPPAPVTAEDAGAGRRQLDPVRRTTFGGIQGDG